jgi:ribosomal protein S3
MAQKVNPLAVRLGVNRGADSSWFSDYYYATLLSQDINLREYLLTVTNRAAGTPLDFKPGRCIIHHYPKISFVHFFFCRLVKNTKRPRSVVTKRKPLYSYESILPTFKHQTAPRANALRRLEAPEASLGGFVPQGGRRLGFKQQQTGDAKASGLRASTTRALFFVSLRSTHAVFKHTFVKHILSEVLLAEPAKLDVRRHQDDTPPALSSLWLDDIAKPRLKQTSNQASQRRALNHLSQGHGPHRNNHTNPSKPGLLNKATPLQTTTLYGPYTGKPNGVALGLKLAKLVEARLNEVRCALAFHKTLQTTPTNGECAVVNQRRSQGSSIAPCRLRHKDTPKGLRSVLLAHSLLMNKATPFSKAQPSPANITPKLADAQPRTSLLGLDPRDGSRLLWWPEARLALRRISDLCLFKVTKPLARQRTTRTYVAFYEHPPRLQALFQKASTQAITRTTIKVDQSAKTPEGCVPLSASEPLMGSRLLGGLLLEEEDGVIPEPLSVSDLKQPAFLTSTSPQFSSGLDTSNTARVAHPNGGKNTTKSVWRPLVYTVHNGHDPKGPMLDTPLGLLTQALTSHMSGDVSQTSDLHDEAYVAVQQHRLFRNKFCSQVSLRDQATLKPAEASAHKALCSTTGTKCQKLKFKRLFNPFVLESVPHFPKLMRLSGWTRLAMLKAQSRPMRYQTPKPLPQSPSVRTQSTGIDTALGSFSQSTTKARRLLPKFVGKPSSTRLSWTKSAALNEGLNHVVVPSEEPGRNGVNANKHQQALVTPAERLSGGAYRVFAQSPDKKTKGWLTHSCLNYYVMHYFSLCKTNRFFGDVNGHVQHVQRHVTETLYLELPLNQSSHYSLSNIQSRIESHTGTLTSILPIKLTSVAYQTAYLVAQDISFKLEQKKSFRQICRAILKQMDLCQSIIKGIRIKCSGRLNGAEIAKTECRKYGETSLHVFSEKIDYAHTKASTPYGILGVKVWIAYV